MAWNDTTKQYELSSETEVLQRLLDTWNQYHGSSLTLNSITGSGLEASFYTYIRGFFMFLETGIQDLQSKITENQKFYEAEIKRPTVVLDNIKAFGTTLGVDMVAYDLNSIKLTGQPVGIYFVYKTQPSATIFDTMVKQCLVAGVVMQGTTIQNIILSNSETIIGKYTIATELVDFRIKLEIKKRIDTAETLTTTEVIKNEIVEYYKQNYTLGMDYNTAQLTKVLVEKFPDIFEIIFYHSLDGGISWLDGGYLIPYNNFINITDTKVVVELLSW